MANGSFPPNQVNNVLIFPGVMWGVIESGAQEITDGMVVAAVKALASAVKPEEISSGIILPAPSIKLSRRIAKAVAKAALKAAPA
ncbi:NAD-dependent malic enzyme [uncultured archaeon]|nr:NAD-dependent malic enzyme [uncultured archaeon]